MRKQNSFEKLTSYLLPLFTLLVLSTLYGFHLSGGFPANQPWRIFFPTVEAVVWSGFLLSYLNAAHLMPASISRPLDFVGKISYSIYLLHITVVLIFTNRGWYFDIRGWPTLSILISTTFLYLPLTLLASWLTYTLIEKPFLDLRRTYVKSPVSLAQGSLRESQPKDSGWHRLFALYRGYLADFERSNRKYIDPLHRYASLAARYDSALVAVFASLIYIGSYLNLAFARVPWFAGYGEGGAFKGPHQIAEFKLGGSLFSSRNPLLGRLFTSFLPSHPFLPNLLLAVGMAVLFYCTARQLVTKMEAAALTGLALIAQQCFQIWTLAAHWNVIPVAFVVYLCVYFSVFRQATVLTMRIFSVAISVAFFCHPWDAPFLCIIFAGGLYALATWRDRLRAGSVFVGAVAFAALISGQPSGSYILSMAGQGMSLTQYPLKLYQILLDTNVIGPSAVPPLRGKMPWLILLIPGVIIVIRRYGPPASAAFLAAITMVGSYLGGIGMVPSQFWDSWGCRYIACWAPFTVLVAYLSITRAWRASGWKAVCGGFAASCLLPLVVGWRPEMVAWWQSTPTSTASAWAVQTQMIDKSFFIHVKFAKPTKIDGLGLQFDRALTGPMANAFSTRSSVKVDGRPLMTPWGELVVHEREDIDALTIFLVNSRVVDDPISQLDLEFDGIGSGALKAIVATRAKFQPFGYLSHVYDRFALLFLEGDIAARLVATPWDLTGSAAGVPDGQLDFAVNCDLPSDLRRKVTDMEIDLHSGNMGGKWATHSRGMNWDKLAFMPGYVEENLRQPQPLTNLADIMHRNGKFTILFKLPEPDRGLPLTLVGLDREGREVFEKEMPGVK